MMLVRPIAALNDNYIWMIVHPALRKAIVVDPGDAQPVIDALQADDLTLEGILITHHHWDHTQGIEALLQYHSAPVYGSKHDQLPACDHFLSEDDEVFFASLDAPFRVMEIPGHTLGHIAYVGNGALFCGDTLFLMGCGRLFEGTPAQMLNTLNKIKHLLPETLIYCAHEYTQANARFALAVEPNNPHLHERINTISALRAQNKPTIPAPLSIELQTNPFLRCDQPEVRAAAEKHAGRSLRDEVAVFATLRAWKDHF